MWYHLVLSLVIHFSGFNKHTVHTAIMNNFIKSLSLLDLQSWDVELCLFLSSPVFHWGSVGSSQAILFPNSAEQKWHAALDSCSTCSIHLHADFIPQPLIASFPPSLSPLPTRIAHIDFFVCFSSWLCPCTLVCQWARCSLHINWTFN